MTATTEGDREVSSNTLQPRLSVLVTLLLLVVAGPALAQASRPHERTPAVSAFPEYPEAARQDRLEGEATVCFTVDAEGRVNRPKIRSSTDKIFEKPTIKAIRASTFEPLEAGAMESPAEACRVYRFKLDPLDPPDPIVAANESTEPPLSLVGSAASLAGNPANPDALAQPTEARQFEPFDLAPESVDAGAPADGDTLITQASNLPVVEPESDRICKRRKRPGSLIAQTYCYTQQEQAANEETNRRSISTLEQEQRWREEQLEAVPPNEYAKGFGLGPR
jgi:TonB family protein